MALNGPRSAFSLPFRAAKQHCRCRAEAATSLPASSRRLLSSSVSRASDAPAAATEQPPSAPAEASPRWAHTPEGMKAPFSLNVAKVPSRQVWQVNEDPEKLDRFYERFLGRDGPRMLPDELKWLAVTHKSFDQGRRGFNTRLAFFGRQIIVLEAMRSIVTSPAKGASDISDPYNRKPFEHPALASVDNLTHRQPQDVLSKGKLARLGLDLGLHDVTRWKPRVPENLKGSGLETVLNTSLFAIVGAISLQHGAEVAGRVVREKVLRRIEQS